MNARQIVEARLAKRPGDKEKLNRLWSKVHFGIVERAATKRPKPKVFEVNHELEVARTEVFVAYADDLPMEEILARVMTKMKLDNPGISPMEGK